MTEVRFHLSDQKGVNTQFDMACQLLTGFLREPETSNYKTYIYTEDESMARHLDDALWIFQPLAFIPHCLYPGDQVAGVLIGHELPEKAMDCLFNLSTRIIPNYDQYARLYELISDDENPKQLARERWRSYSNQGHTPKAYKVNGIYNRFFLYASS